MPPVMDRREDSPLLACELRQRPERRRGKDEWFFAKNVTVMLERQADRRLVESRRRTNVDEIESLLLDQLLDRVVPAYVWKRCGERRPSSFAQVRRRDDLDIL